MNCLILLFTGLTALISYGQQKGKREAISTKPYKGLHFKINNNWEVKFSGQVNAYYVLTA
ncbi:MAG: hypothetical protein ACK5H1_05555 [Tenacibaculum sp.]